MKRAERFLHYATINALWLSLTVQDTALLTISIPAAIAQIAPQHHVAVLAALVSISNIAAMLVPPFAGWLSDRSRARGGTRRTWILAGVAVDVAALVGLAYTRDLALFSALFVLAVAAENVAIAAYQAMIPEVVPREAWGAASGIRGAATLVGTVIGLGVAGSIANVNVVFFATAALLALGTLTLFFTRERERTVHERVEVTRWHDFVVVFIARSFIFFGLSLLMTFVLYFFSDILKVKDAGAGTASIGIFSLLGAIASSVYFGIASDRIPRKLLVAGCGLPMAAAAIGFALAPTPAVMFVFAALFGIGFGGVMAVGWAIAIDSLPQLSDVARDLGIWGIATNLPSVIAPVVGGRIIDAFGGGKTGYQLVFALAGVSFALGSVTVLRVGATPLSSLLAMPLWIAACTAVFFYTSLKHRIRGWGRLPRRRGGTLVGINHQHAIESTTIVSRLGLQSSLRHPVFSSTGRRMWEPGFFYLMFPWLPGFMRGVSMGWLWRGLGFMPIENMLFSRPAASLGFDAERLHGPMPVARLFSERIAARFAPGTMTSELRSAKNFKRAQEMVGLKDVQEPYRNELLDLTRAQVEADIEAMERVVARGATFFLTPEGQFNTRGEMNRLRRLLPRLADAAESVYAVGISYDALRMKKMSMLYRLVPVRDRRLFGDVLVAARPVTVTQLLASWLDVRPEPFTESDAIAAVRAALREVPPALFIDPELAADPETVTKEALRSMRAQGFTSEAGGAYAIASRTETRFEKPFDVFRYHAVFYGESVAAAIRLSAQPG